MRLRKYNNKYVAYTGNHKGEDGTVRPSIGLSGVYLQAFGFEPGMWVSGETAPGSIAFTVLNMTLELYESFMGGKQPDNVCLIKVGAYTKNNRRFPLLYMSGQYLERCGFAAGEPVTIQWKQGRVTIRKIGR